MSTLFILAFCVVFSLFPFNYCQDAADILSVCLLEMRISKRTFALFNTNTKKCSSHGTKQQPKELFESRSKSLLFAGKAKTGIKISEKYLHGSSHSHALGEWTAGMDYGDWYKSPLFDAWSDLPIKNITLTLIKNKVKVCWIAFDGRDSGRSSWFSAQRMIGSYPWDINKLKSRNFNDFLIDFTSPNYPQLRRKFITFIYSGCDTDSGLIILLEANDVCSWAGITNPTRILWTHNPATQDVGVFLNSQDADEIVIEAELEDDSVIYA